MVEGLVQGWFSVLSWWVSQSRVGFGFVWGGGGGGDGFRVGLGWVWGLSRMASGWLWGQVIKEAV